MRVGIIGAGIGGLVAALGLQHDGHDVTVFERQSGVRAIGAGLSVFGNSAAALNEIGLAQLLPAPMEASARSTAGQRTPSGRWLTVMPAGAVESLRVVHRVQLQEALVAALREGSLRTGVEASVRPDGSPSVMGEGFDLVIAADGIRSGARSSLGLDPGLRYAGYTAWRGVTRAPVDVGGEAGETWGRGRRFGVVPLADGRVYWFATESQPAGGAFPDERAHLIEEFGGWHAPIPALLQQTPAADVLRHDIHDLACPLPTFVRGRIALLGDAAHAMTPDLGQGAGQAIEDAATITILLRGASGEADIDLVLARYDAERRARTQAIARRSRSMGAIGQLAGLPGALRDAALALAPSAVVGMAAQRMQRWSPPKA